MLQLYKQRGKIYLEYTLSVNSESIHYLAPRLDLIYKTSYW